MEGCLINDAIRDMQHVNTLAEPTERSQEEPGGARSEPVRRSQEEPGSGQECGAMSRQEQAGPPSGRNGTPRRRMV